MALTDHSDVFIGSTGDGWTFVVLNRRIRNGARILTGAGFTAREHQGRTLYLLPPETAQDAHERAGVAAYGLMAHTLDLVDLAWTTRQHGGTPSREPDVTICFTDHAGGEAAVRAVTRARRKRRSQRRCPRRVPLYADGISVRIDLGIATPQDIPPAPSRPGAAPAPPLAPPVRRRSR